MSLPMKMQASKSGLRTERSKCSHPSVALFNANRSIAFRPDAPRVRKSGHKAPRTRKLGMVVAQQSAVAPPQAAPQKPPEVQAEIEEVALYPVYRDISVIRCSSRDRLKYEIEFGLKRGTTDNCYIISGRGKDVVLIDVPVQAYGKEFEGVFTDSVGAATLTHILLTHTAPNRLPALENILRARLKLSSSGQELPKLKVFLSNPSLQLVKENIGAKEDGSQLLDSVEWSPVQTGTSLKLGDGSQLDFVLVPTPRWPTLMAVYDGSTNVLFSSKFFSAHVCPSIVGRKASAGDLGGWQLYGQDWKYFFDCMFAPVARQASQALDRLNLDAALSGAAGAPLGALISLGQSLGSLFGAVPSSSGSKVPKIVARRLAPLHGPVVKVSTNELLRQYQGWIQEQLKSVDDAKVAVLYASAYGNTAALAQALSQGVIKSGVAVETINLELVTPEEVTEAVRTASGFMIGSPTLGGHMPTQVSAALGTILKLPNAKEQPCGVFGSFGWSGEAVDEMDSRLKNAGFGQAFDSIKVKFRPTAKDLQVCTESGRQLAMAVKKKISNRDRSQAKATREVVGSGPTLAAGRLVGSLCVVTAKDEDATSAMLASWVSQASFNPPGLTVAVKKDRAIEGLLAVGAKMAMSIVPEDLERPVMKQLARPFKAGVDRLAGLDTTISETSGCPVLTASHATLDCSVVSRMEAGDHIIIYCQVDDGKLKDDTKLTAVHHRKVGNHY